ncbi:chromate transporter [Nocardioides baekrokdamisoli]|uniref:Chromate transporter n=1 Tax=Nocardioides baekrokdamisoli TaxID=1804624 RepID=A0A3G9IEN4_9ACTN|nr:chromate transporter [Nocardioides baekrokdamisoli]BBH17450.1 chromate transporter [Nocardioides baekrokdamisoli]
MVAIRQILLGWGRIGIVGFGGPPAHIRLLRELCVERNEWIDAVEFEDAIAVCNLLPGPASTQLSIWSAWRVGGRLGGLVGGLAFIVPGFVVILALSMVFLSGHPPRWILGAGAGAGAAVAAVALHAGWTLTPTSWQRTPSRVRWGAYALAAAVAAAVLGPWVVVVLLGCGVAELGWSRYGLRRTQGTINAWTLPALLWTAVKVGALSYGGGFVIIPLMRGDAVDKYGWLSSQRFLDAVALGQITPGPVVHTVGAVGYAAAGVPGAVLATVVAFTPSFLFVLLGAPRFDRIRGARGPRAFLAGAGPAAIGAIVGSSIPLARALNEPWQWVVLATALILLFVGRVGIVTTLVIAAVAGVLAL